MNASLCYFLTGYTEGPKYNLGENTNFYLSDLIPGLLDLPHLTLT